MLAQQMSDLDVLLSSIGIASLTCTIILTVVFRARFRSVGGWILFVIGFALQAAHRVVAVSGGDDTMWLRFDHVGVFLFLVGLVLHLRGMGYSILRELKGYAIRTRKAAGDE